MIARLDTKWRGNQSRAYASFAISQTIRPLDLARSTAWLNRSFAAAKKMRRGAHCYGAPFGKAFLLGQIVQAFPKEQRRSRMRVALRELTRAAVDVPSAFGQNEAIRMAARLDACFGASDLTRELTSSKRAETSRVFAHVGLAEGILSSMGTPVPRIQMREQWLWEPTQEDLFAKAPPVSEEWILFESSFEGRTSGFRGLEA